MSSSEKRGEKTEGVMGDLSKEPLPRVWMGIGLLVGDVECLLLHRFPFISTHKSAYFPFLILSPIHNEE